MSEVQVTAPVIMWFLGHNSSTLASGERYEADSAYIFFCRLSVWSTLSVLLGHCITLKAIRAKAGAGPKLVRGQSWCGAKAGARPKSAGFLLNKFKELDSGKHESVRHSLPFCVTSSHND